MDFEDTLAQLRSRHGADAARLAEKLSEAECARRSLECDVGQLRDRLEAMRRDAQLEQQEALNSLSRKYSRERALLEEGERAASSQLHTVSTAANGRYWRRASGRPAHSYTR